MATLTVYPSGHNPSLSSYSEAKFIEKSYRSARSIGSYGTTLTWGEYAVFYSAPDSYSKYASVTYTFNLSALPANAIINNVTCVVTAHNYNGSNSYGTTNTVSLGIMSDTTFTAQASATPAIGGSFTNMTLSGGSWTRDALQNCGLRLLTSNSWVGDSDTQFYVACAGATLTVDYTVPISGYVNIGGVNKELSGGYVNIEGVWKKIVRTYMNINGVWKETSQN